METKTLSNAPVNSATTRRRRRNGDQPDARFFLPKGGSSAANPELGQEVASEGEALIQAFRTGQTFYTLTAWKAVPEMNGESSPVIVKQAVAPRQVQS